MIHLRGQDNLYVEASLAGFTKQLKDDGIIARQVDLLLIGAAYAIRVGLDPLDSLKRHDLVKVASISPPDVIHALEAALPWYTREHGLPEPQDYSSLLELLAGIGSAGVAKLKESWEQLSPGQIRLKLMSIAHS